MSENFKLLCELQDCVNSCEFHSVLNKSQHWLRSLIGNFRKTIKMASNDRHYCQNLDVVEACSTLMTLTTQEDIVDALSFKDYFGL